MGLGFRGDDNQEFLIEPRFDCRNSAIEKKNVFEVCEFQKLPSGWKYQQRPHWDGVMAI